MALILSPTDTEVAVKLLIATGLGALIGLERELKFSPAGLKTYSIVSLGAALFTVLSSFISPAIATGAVTGVGFLGAGAIFRAKTRVRGLTTAALIWVSASIGMTVGFGYYVIAIITTAILFAILVVMGYIEKNYVEKIAEEGINLENPVHVIRQLRERIRRIEKFRKLKKRNKSTSR